MIDPMLREQYRMIKSAGIYKEPKRNETIEQRRIKRAEEKQKEREIMLDKIAGDMLILNKLVKSLFADDIYLKDDLKKAFSDFEYNVDDIMEAIIKADYIYEVPYKGEIKNSNKVIIDATASFIERILKYKDVLYKNTYNKACSKDKQGRFLTAYRRGISDHSSIEHLLAIERLKTICDSEKLEYRYLYDETIMQTVHEDFNYKKKRVEADLLIKYNKQWIIAEVERGTTSQTNMNTKMEKILSASNNFKNVVDGCKMSKVVLICSPNQKSLDKTKAKIEEWQRQLKASVDCGDRATVMDLEIAYINLSSIKDKPNKRLKSRIKEAYSSKNKKA